jgi:hypothetical protein
MANRYVAPGSTDHSPTDWSLEPKLEILRQLIAIGTGARWSELRYWIGRNVPKIDELLENA